MVEAIFGVFMQYLELLNTEDHGKCMGVILSDEHILYLVESSMPGTWYVYEENEGVSERIYRGASKEKCISEILKIQGMYLSL